MGVSAVGDGVIAPLGPLMVSWLSVNELDWTGLLNWMSNKSNGGPDGPKGVSRVT